jgi:ribosomal protein L13E
MSEAKKIEEVEADTATAAKVVEKPEPVIKDLVAESESDQEKKTLSFEKTFSFEWTDGEGVLLHGHFTARRFTIRDMGAVGVDKARLNAGETGLDNFTDYLHEMLAFCRYALTDVPSWWTPEEFYDPAPLQSVYKHVLDWHASFR